MRGPWWLPWAFLAVFALAGLAAVFIADPTHPSKVLSVVLLSALVAVIATHTHRTPH